MDMKNRLKKISFSFFQIVGSFILLYVVATTLFFAIDNFGYHSVGNSHEFLQSSLKTNSTHYDVNDTVFFTLLYARMDKNANIGLKFCTDDNIMDIYIYDAQLFPKEKLKYPLKYRIQNQKVHAGENVHIHVNCPKDLLANNGMFNFEDVDTYRVDFKMKFARKGETYYLLGSDRSKLEISAAPNYYEASIYFEESFMAEGFDNAIFLSVSFYAEIKEGILYIFIPKESVSRSTARQTLERSPTEATQVM